MKLGLDDVAILLLEKFSDIRDSVVTINTVGPYLCGYDWNQEYMESARQFHEHITSITRVRGMYGEFNERVIFALEDIPFLSWSRILAYGPIGCAETILEAYHNQRGIHDTKAA